MSRVSEIQISEAVTLLAEPPECLSLTGLRELGDGVIVRSPVYGIGTVRVVGAETYVRFLSGQVVDGKHFWSTPLSKLVETLSSGIEPVSSQPTNTERSGDGRRELWHYGECIGEWIDKTEERKDPTARYVPGVLTMMRYGFARFRHHPMTPKVNFNAFCRVRRGMKDNTLEAHFTGQSRYSPVWSRVDLLEICE